MWAGMRRLVTFFAVAIVSAVAWAAPAGAHAELRHTQPTSGAQLDSPPERVTLTFTEPVDVSVGGIRVYDADGERLDRERPYKPDGRGEQVALDLPDLAESAYVVTWRVISADSHPLQGAFTFRVGDVADGDTQALAERLLAADGGDTLVGGLYAAARVLLFASLLLLVGAVAFVVTLWPNGARNRTTRALVSGALMAAVIATAAAFVLQGAYGAGLGLSAAVDPDVLSAAADTRFGKATLIRVGLLAVAAVLLAVAARTGRGRRRGSEMAAMALVGLGLLGTVAASGHASTGRWVAFAFAVDVVHLAAAAVWLGGLALVAVAVLRQGDAEEMSRVVPRFSKVAFAAVLVIIVTGSFQSWRQVGSLDALTGTTYGRLLTFKVAFFAAMVVLAAISRSWVRRHYRNAAVSPGDHAPASATPDTRSLRRSVMAEAAAAVAVLVATALLVNAIPGRTALALPHTIELEIGEGLLVDVTVDPAKAGPLDLHLYTLTPAGLPAEVEEVTAELRLADRDIGPIDVPLQRAGPNHFVAYGFDVPIPGEWRLDVTVRTSDIRQDTATASVPIR